jgi:hypothetical protein
MLAWSLWLAWLLARWMRTAWASFTTDGAWRRWKLTLPFKRKLVTAAAAAGDARAAAPSGNVSSEEASIERVSNDGAA